MVSIILVFWFIPFYMADYVFIAPAALGRKELYLLFYCNLKIKYDTYKSDGKSTQIGSLPSG